MNGGAVYALKGRGILPVKTALCKKGGRRMSVMEVTKDSFEKEVLQSDKPVLVDFWAVWCGPCRMVSPVVEEIALEHPEIKVCKINVDQEQELARRYRIMSIPSLYVFKNGEVANKTIGAVPKQNILAMLD